MKTFPVILFGKEIGQAGTHREAYDIVYNALLDEKKSQLDDVYLDQGATIRWIAFSGTREFYNEES